MELKGEVSFGRTVKKYNTVRIEWSQEFDQSQTTHEEVARALQQRVDKFLEEIGVQVVGPG